MYIFKYYITIRRIKNELNIFLIFFLNDHLMHVNPKLYIKFFLKSYSNQH
jgi:hypothetical protein